jgi:hypothetical protein
MGLFTTKMASFIHREETRGDVLSVFPHLYKFSGRFRIISGGLLIFIFSGTVL